MAYLYNPDDLDKLKELPQFKVDLPELDAVLKYTILMYDFGSELRRTYTDSVKRKKEAARRANFKLTRTGAMTGYTQEILLGLNKGVNELILSYLKLFNNPWILKYAAAWSLMDAEILDSQNLSERTPKERETISNNIEKLTDRIDECEKHIFEGLESDMLRNQLFADMEKDKEVRLRPELVAVDLEKKEADLGVSPFYPKIQ